MGTRNLTQVYFNGELWMSQYGQWSGEPGALGDDILSVLRSTNPEEIKERCNFVRLRRVSEDEEITVISPNEPDVKMSHDDVMAKYVTEDQESYFWRDTGGADVLHGIVQGRVKALFLDDKFAYDGLFCEWCYVIDLDTNTFEVYRGFNKSSMNLYERFYLPVEEWSCEYSPVVLIATYDLYALPENLSELYHKDNE